VPERATLSLEYRAPREHEFKNLETALLQLAEKCAREYGLEVEIIFLDKHPPVLMSRSMQALITRTAADLGLKSMPLASGACHDAQSLAKVCPAGMIFVPSKAGASHSAREFTRWEDCVNGANVLLQSALSFK